MEIELISSEGIPSDSLVSIRVAGQCRQGPANSKKPYKFAAQPENSVLRVSVLTPNGTSRVVTRPGTSEYVVSLPKLDGSGNMELKLGLSASAEAAAQSNDASTSKGKNGTTKAGGKSDPDGKRAQAASTAKSYLTDHKLTDFLQSLLQGLLEEMPGDPYAWLGKQLTSGGAPPAGKAKNPMVVLNRAAKPGGQCVITGPSGVGKSTLIKALMAKYPGKFGFCVSHTTRDPRPGEQNGVDYHFVTKEAMKQDIAAGKFIEHAEVHGNFYGTSVASVESVTTEGKICLLDIDVKGADSVRASSLHPSASYIFLAPPNMQVLEERLRGRGTETEDKIQKRLAGAIREMQVLEDKPEAWDLILRYDKEDYDNAHKEFQSFLAQKIPKRIGVLNRGPKAIGGACVITGPSGVGKSTLINSLMKTYPGKFGFSVSHTTRDPRPGEQDGVDYHFVTKEAMKQDIAAGKFIEHAEVHGNFYGTSVASVESVTKAGKVCLLDIDVQGADTVRQSSLHASTSYLFLAPPSMEVLEARLRGRGTETEEKIQKRLAGALREMAVLESKPEAWDLILKYENAQGAQASAEFNEFLAGRIASSAKNSAFVFIKPHAHTDHMKKLVEEQFAAFGIQIDAEGKITGEDIDKKKLIDQHYYAIASKATILKPDQVNVPADKFKEKFGFEWKDVLSSGKAFNALDGCAHLGITGDDLGKVWVEAGNKGKVVKLGGGFYCGEIAVPGKEPVYVLNAFFMAMRGKFTAPGSSIWYYSVSWDANKLSWSDFRGKVLGPTDPSKAPAGSLRGKACANWQSLGMKSAPNTTDNAVHASASPFEGLAERVNWLSATVEGDAFGAQILQAGVSKDMIMSWSVDPQVNLGNGKKGSLFDNLEDIDSAECLDKCVALAKLQTRGLVEIRQCAQKGFKDAVTSGTLSSALSQSRKA